MSVPRAPKSTVGFIDQYYTGSIPCFLGHQTGCAC
jgi:hypothetical protein